MALRRGKSWRGKSLPKSFDLDAAIDVAVCDEEKGIVEETVVESDAVVGKDQLWGVDNELK